MKYKKMILIAFIFILLSAVVLAQTSEPAEEDAFNAILTAEENIQEMADSGFNVTLANDLLTDAKAAFAGENYSKLLAETEKIGDAKKREQAKKLIEAAKKTLGEKKGDYPLVMRKTEEIKDLKERVYEVYDLLKALEIRISELEDIIELEDAKIKLSEAKKEFYLEAYDNAESIANQGFAIVDKKAAEATELNLLYKAGKENITYFVKNNWKNLLVGLFFAIVLGIVLYFQISAILRKRRFENLKLEKQVLLDLMRRAQYERFNKGLITNKEYEIKTSKFKERLIEVEKEIPILEDKVLHRKKHKQPKKEADNNKKEVQNAGVQKNKT